MPNFIELAPSIIRFMFMTKKLISERKEYKGIELIWRIQDCHYNYNKCGIPKTSVTKITSVIWDRK
jgi:hypothetical protein